MDNKIKSFNLVLNHLNLNMVNFKQKQVSIIKNSIANGRLNDYMRFSEYAHISFNDTDTVHEFPNIEILDKFNRVKCNCLVYDLSYNASNNGIYDKCFIYLSEGHSHNYYGYIFYNTKTEKTINRCLLEEATDNLCIKLAQSFNTMKIADVYEHYWEKHNCLKEKYGKHVWECPTITDYHKMLESHNEKLSIETSWSA